jgi:hypothetical protein
MKDSPEFERLINRKLDGELTLDGIASFLQPVWNRHDNKTFAVPQMLRELGLAGFENSPEPVEVAPS